MKREDGKIWAILSLQGEWFMQFPALTSWSCGSRRNSLLQVIAARWIWARVAGL